VFPMSLVGRKLVCSLHFSCVFKRFRLSSVVLVRGWRCTVWWEFHHTDAVVSVGSISASPGCLFEGACAPKFDGTVEVSKRNVQRDESHIRRISGIVTPKLHSLAEQSP